MHKNTIGKALQHACEILPSFTSQPVSQQVCTVSCNSLLWPVKELKRYTHSWYRKNFFVATQVVR